MTPTTLDVLIFFVECWLFGALSFWLGYEAGRLREQRGSK